MKKKHSKFTADFSQHDYRFEKLHDLPESVRPLLNGRTQDIHYRCTCGMLLIDGRRLNPGEAFKSGDPFAL